MIRYNILFPADAGCVSTGRNGSSKTTGAFIETDPTARFVTLTAINSNHNLIVGDIQITPEAMDERCAEWIAQRGVDFNPKQVVKVERQYDCEKISVVVNEQGIEVKRVEDGEELSIAYVDMYYLLDASERLPKAGCIQTVVYDHRAGFNDHGPVACAVATDDGLIVHVGDAGEVVREDNPFSAERYLIRTSSELEPVA